MTRCADDPLQPGKVVCDCEIPPEGLNVGDSSCESRRQKLTSTFSLWDLTQTATKPAKKSLACVGENANAWVFCLDSTREKTEPSRAKSSCTLAAASDSYALDGDCDVTQYKMPTTALDKKRSYKYWSGASLTEFLSDYDQLWRFYENIPLLNFCQP